MYYLKSLLRDIVIAVQIMTSYTEFSGSGIKHPNGGTFTDLQVLTVQKQCNRGLNKDLSITKGPTTCGTTGCLSKKQL